MVGYFLLIIHQELHNTVKPPLVDSPNKGHLQSIKHDMHRLHVSIQINLPTKDNTECTNVFVIERFCCNSFAPNSGGSVEVVLLLLQVQAAI